MSEEHGPRPDPSDKNAYMQWMRSHIRSGEERKAPKTNDFALNQVIEQKGMRPLRKWSNEHVKCVVVTVREKSDEGNRAKSYIVGFLSDSNRFSFEIFRDTPYINDKMTNPGQFRMLKIVRMFENKKIDGDTVMIVSKENTNQREFFPMVLNFISHMTGCRYNNVDNARALFVLDKEFNIFRKTPSKNKTVKYFKKLTKGGIFKRMTEAYNFIAESGLCPWISENEVKRNEKLTRRIRHGVVVAELMMIVAMIWNYKNLEKKLKEEKI